MKYEKLANQEKLTSQAIFLLLISFILFIESIITILKGINNGLRRKEVLTKTANIGFNLDIIVR